MKWLKNLESLSDKGSVGTCPHCGSSDTDYCYTAVDLDTRMGFCDLWCNSCKHGFHVSRVKVPDKAKTGKAPSNVIY
jgi:hypothetical protein